MAMTVRGWGLAVAALVGAAAPSLLSMAIQQPTFRGSVNLIRVDVVATDKTGHPVHGLTKDDFVMLDDGKVVPVATFAEVRRDVAPPRAPAARVERIREDVADNRAATASHLIVLFIDDTHIWTGRTDRVKTIARQVIQELGREASMAILFSGEDHDVEVTQDRAILLESVDRFKGRRMLRRPFDAQDCISPRVAGCNNLDDFFNDLGLYRRLREAAKFVADARSDRKAFILISESSGRDLTGLFENGAPLPSGFASNPLTQPRARTSDAAGRSDNVPLASDPWSADKTHDYAGSDLIAMMTALEQSNVSVYSIDPRGYVPSEKLLYECFPVSMGDDPCMVGTRNDGPPDVSSWVRRAQHSLEHISEASGGFAVVNTDDFTSGLGRILDDLDNYYLLGFYPPNSKAGSYRPLQVNVNRPGITVRYRHGYDPAGPPPSKNTNPLAAMAESVLPATDLPLRMTSTVLPGPGRDVQVVLALEVASGLHGLVGPDHKMRDTVKYLVMGADLKTKKIAGHIERKAQIVLAPRRQNGAPADPDHITYAIVTSITLPPGAYQLRSSVSSAGLKTGGSVYQVLDIPDFTKAPLVLGGIALATVGSERVPVAESTLARDALPFYPTLDREFAATDELQVFAPVGGADLGAATARVEIREGGDHLLRAIDAPVTTHRHLAELGGRPVTATVRQVQANLPLGGLSAGAYVLRVAVRTEHSTVQSEIGVSIK